MEWEERAKQAGSLQGQAWRGPDAAGSQNLGGALGGQPSGNYSNQPTDPSSTPVRDAITRLEETTQQLFQLAEMLEQRLDTILSSSSPTTPASVAAVGRGSTCLLQGRLNVLQEGLQGLGNKLAVLGQRIQL